MCDVWPVIGGNWLSVTEFRRVVMEVEFSMLQSQISESSSWHQVSLDIASFVVISFAYDYVVLLLELFF